MLVCRKSQVPKFFLQGLDIKVSRFLSDSVKLCYLWSKEEVNIFVYGISVCIIATRRLILDSKIQSGWGKMETGK